MFFIAQQTYSMSQLFSTGMLFQAGENKPMKQMSLKPILKKKHLNNEVTHGYNFSLSASFFFSERFCTNECDCLNMDHVCLIDN